MRYPIDEKTEAHLSEMMLGINLTKVELERIRTEKKLKGRLLELQAIYDRRKTLRDEAYRAYNNNKLTISTFISEATSFSRPTLYSDPLLKQYAEFLVKKCNENDANEKMYKAVQEKQALERYNAALVDDVIELLHNQKEYTRLLEEIEVKNQRIKELETQMGIKDNVLPVEKRVVIKPNNLEGVFPIDLCRN